MNKIVGIIPSFIDRRNSIGLIIENTLIKFVKKCFPNYEIKILFDNKIKGRIDLIISSGGNTVISIKNSNANLFRKKLDEYYLKKALKNNIKFLGICHGAQYVANYFGSEIKKKKHHTRTEHKIKFSSKKVVTVNSYHDYSVITLGKNLKKIAWSSDGSVEAFKHTKKKLLSIMWHPERYKKIKNFDLRFIKKYL